MCSLRDICAWALCNENTPDGMRNKQEQAWWGSFPGDAGLLCTLTGVRLALAACLSRLPPWLLVVAALTFRGPQVAAKPACRLSLWPRGRNPPSSAGDVGSIPGLGTKIPHAPGTTMKILQTSAKTQINKEFFFLIQRKSLPALPQHRGGFTGDSKQSGQELGATEGSSSAPHLLLMGREVQRNRLLCLSLTSGASSVPAAGAPRQDPVVCECACE